MSLGQLGQIRSPSHCGVGLEQKHGLGRYLHGNCLVGRGEEDFAPVHWQGRVASDSVSLDHYGDALVAEGKREVTPGLV